MVTLTHCFTTAALLLAGGAVVSAAPAANGASITFHGSQTAELFSRELDESVRGVIENSIVRHDDARFPKGFVRASLPGQWWDDSCWSRDTGVFLRELSLWGHLDSGALVAEYLCSHVTPNADGYRTFPNYYNVERVSGSGTEMDGTSEVIIGLVRLWQRLPATNPTRAMVWNFLTAADSPMAYLQKQLEQRPLIAGSGEFGGGPGIQGDWYNVVSNNLCRQGLLASAELMAEGGKPEAAAVLRAQAAKLGEAIQAHLVQDGRWLWCIFPETLAADPKVLNHPKVRGQAAINGASAAYADAEGLEPVQARWPGAGPARATLAAVYNDYPVRKEQFAKYGMCTYVDGAPTALMAMTSWLSYCDCYAAQTMLLLDQPEHLDRIMTWIAAATYMEGSPTPEFIDRLARGQANIESGLRGHSKYWFMERNFSPDFKGRRDIGCGKLNLVNVAEPMKLARIMLGLDDRYGDTVNLVPRLPPSWTGFEAKSWPVKTKTGVVRVDVRFERKAPDGFTLHLDAHGTIPKLAVRFPDGTRRELGAVSGAVEVQ